MSVVQAARIRPVAAVATTIDIIRHGEPVGGRRYRGNGVDDPLSAEGWQQMWAALGDHAPWSRIVTSPMRRCRGFAEALAEKWRMGLTVDERLKEIGFGAWEGLRHEEVQQRYPQAYEAFYRDPVNQRPPGAEPAEAFFRRVSAGLEGLVRDYACEHVLLVAHAGVIRAALAYVLETPLSEMYRMKVPYAGLTRLSADRRGLQVEWFNRASL